MPWGVLFMVGGMCTFINTGVHMGIIDVVAQFIGDTIPGRWMPLALSVIASLMSFVVTGPGVIYPLFMPMVPVLAEVSGANPLLCAAALVCGVLPTGMCPLSQGGASAQLGATDEVRQKIFWPQTRAAALDAIIFAVLAAAGWYTVIGKLFGVA